MSSATLRFFLEDIKGTPAGPVSLLHSVSNNDLEASPTHHEDESYLDTGLDLVGPTGVSQTYYELDVTDEVLLDYSTDAEDLLSSFRLQIDSIDFVDDDQEGRYRFTMPGAEANHPELVLTFIPEPPAFVLAAVGLFGLLTSDRRRRGRTASPA